MTTDLRVATAPDLSTKNDVISLGMSRQLSGVALSGVSWSLSSSAPYEPFVNVLRFVFRLISGLLPNYQIWLLIGNSTWQEDTRIARYRKLWGSLKARGVEVAHADHLQEVMLEAEGRLKFFGAVRLSELSIQSAVKAVLEERCSYLVALPTDNTPQEILKMGWSGEIVDDYRIVLYLHGIHGLLLKRIGDFDDQERGFLAIGAPGILTALLADVAGRSRGEPR